MVAATTSLPMGLSLMLLLLLLLLLSLLVAPLSSSCLVFDAFCGCCCCCFILSTLRNFARRFWNQTCNRRTTFKLLTSGSQPWDRDPKLGRQDILERVAQNPYWLSITVPLVVPAALETHSLCICCVNWMINTKWYFRFNQRVGFNFSSRKYLGQESHNLFDSAENAWWVC